MKLLGLIMLQLLFAVGSVTAPTSLFGKWRIVAIDGADRFDLANTLAEFADAGRFTSTIGWNRVVGKPAITGTQLGFGSMAATRMACIPPLECIESQYLAVLQAVRSYKLDGDTLAFIGANGEEGLKFKRSE
jgi:heat shock protein HslJ